jgi:hypothetical protein
MRNIRTNERNEKTKTRTNDTAEGMREAKKVGNATTEREAGEGGRMRHIDERLETLTVGGPVPSPSRKPQLPSSNHTSRYPSKASSHPDPVPKVMRYPAFS